MPHKVMRVCRTMLQNGLQKPPASTVKSTPHRELRCERHSARALLSTF